MGRMYARIRNSRILGVREDATVFIPLFKLFLPFLCLFLVGFTLDEGEPEDKDPVEELIPCQLCHEVEDCQWKLSRHSKSMGSSFLNEWELSNKDEKCLECHADIHIPQTGNIAKHAVSCESCHGPDNPDHPNQTKMVLPATSEVCKDCHCVTWGQWRVSSHGENNVQCFDCHKVHQTILVTENPDELCGTCHKEQLSDFIKASHTTAKLHCVNCHMPEPVGIQTECQGKNVRGHTFNVTSWPCSDCHSDMVHRNPTSPAPR